MTGFVYLIGTPVFGWYKIGKSITPEVRIRDLGILLPFKIDIIAVWQAQDHSMLERTLHEIYASSRINGEWFEFARKEVQTLIESIPAESKVYPGQLENVLDRFSNIIEDTRLEKKVIGVRTQKLRGNFTTEEREEKRQAAIERQRLKRQAKPIENQ